jgi:hypothetical protein
MRATRVRSTTKYQKQDILLNKEALLESIDEALYVPPDALDTFEPPPTLKAIAKQMLAGVHGKEDICTAAGVTEDEYHRTMERPVCVVWLSRLLTLQISNMLGIADLAMFRKAVAGDVPAYKALQMRLGNMVQKREEIRVSVDGSKLDLTRLQKYSTEELEQIASQNESELKRLKEKSSGGEDTGSGASSSKKA